MIRDMSLSKHTQALLAAYQHRQPLDAHPSANPAPDPSAGPIGSAEAYAVQRAVWQALAGNVRPTAWKVAAAGPGEMPMAAPILPQRLLNGTLNAPAKLPVQTLIRPGIEAEIAVRFGRDLPPRATPYQPAEIRAAIADLCVTMEVVDSRLADPQAAGPDWRLADHLLNGALVVGTTIRDWQDLRLDDLLVRVRAGGQVLANRTGTQPLGDLFHCLPWFIAHIGGVHAGDVVTTGAWTGKHPLEGLARVPFVCEVEFSDMTKALGSVSLTLN